MLLLFGIYLWATNLNPSLMHFFKRRVEAPAMVLHTSEGRQTPLKVTFRNGEIHINSDAMERGSYKLTISSGVDTQYQAFTIW